MGLGLIVGVVAVAGMTAIIGYIDEIPVMPQNAQEWRETIEYATSITLATLTGYLLAIVLRNILHQQTLERGRPSATAIRIAAMVGPNVGRQALRRRAERIGGMMTIMKSIGTALGSADRHGLYRRPRLFRHVARRQRARRRAACAGVDRAQARLTAP